MVTATGATESKPYPGTESFQVEDAPLFFGREQDADRVASTILSTRFTLLHAQSGIGKTSLLNARIIPRLEAEAWTPVRVLVQHDPIASVRATTLQYVLPPPEGEVAALERASSALLGDGAATASIAALLECYRRLPVRAPERRALVAPFPAADDANGNALTAGPTTPFVVRLLRGSVSPTQFAAHVRALVGPDALVVPSTTVAELGALFRAERAAATHASLLAELRAVPERELAPFFDRLCALWGTRHSDFGIVLILDQFEELFTRFTDRGAAAGAAPSAAPNVPRDAPESAAARASSIGATHDQPNWWLRVEFLAQLERLYAQTRAIRQSAGAGLPLRIVLSMRDEFVAQLDDVRRFVPDLAGSTVHLRPLTVSQAAEALRRPAVHYGYTYHWQCFRKILSRLRQERRFIEPAQLQLVCERLWDTCGRALAATAGAVRPANASHRLPSIDLADYEKLGGVEGILAHHVRTVITTRGERGALVPRSDADRLEILEMLAPLITVNRGVSTRNIAAWEALVEVAFRSRAKREELLGDLVKRGIARAERRLAGRLVEITHEFLIPAIQEEIAKAAAGGEAAFRDALRVLESFVYRDGTESGVRQHLPRRTLDVLHDHRTRIVWPLWAVELMLRSVIADGADGDALSEWYLRHQKAAATAVPTIDELFAGNRPPVLLRRELVLLWSRTDGVPLDEPKLRVALRSALSRGGDGDRDLIRHWTIRHAARA